MSISPGYSLNRRAWFVLIILLGCGFAVHYKGSSGLQIKRRTAYSTVSFDATHLPHPTVHTTSGSSIGPEWAEDVARECDSLFYPSTVLPYFNTSSELERCPQWMSYLSRIYGLATLTYPVDVANFTFFYGDHPALSKYKHYVKAKNESHFGELFKVSLAPSKNGLNKELWMRHVHGTREISNFNNLHLYMEEESNTGTELKMGNMDIDTLARLDTLLQVPVGKNRWKLFSFGNHSKVEVFHECCDHPETGFWFALAPGSGVFYDVGRSQVFRTHQDACLFYGNQSCSFTDIFSMLRFVKDSARNNGFDSLQFTDHWPGGSVSVYEIWDIRESLPQQTACPPIHLDKNCSDCVQNFLFGGWKAAHRCICDTQEGGLLTCITPRKQPINLTIAVTGDIHGYVQNVPQASARLNALRKVHNDSMILINTGDSFVGSTLFSSAGPIGISDSLSNLSYDVMGVGNHDLEFSSELDYLSGVVSPLAAFNIEERAVDRYIVLQIGGQDICVTGYTVADKSYQGYVSPYASLFLPKLLSLLTFLRGICCQTILIGHGGIDLDLQISAAAKHLIDIFVGGHDHIIYSQSIYRSPESIIIHAGQHLESITVLYVDYDVNGMRTASSEIFNFEQTLNPLSKPLIHLESMEKRQRQNFSKHDSRMCRYQPCLLGSWVAEFMFLSAACEHGQPVQAALRESGSIRGIIHGQTITKESIHEMLPWNNELVVVDIDKDSLKDMLTFSERRMGGSRLNVYGLRSFSGEMYTFERDEVRTRCESHRRDRATDHFNFGRNYSTSRHVLKSDTVPVVMTRWLAEGGDGFRHVLPLEEPVVVGREASLFVNMFITTTATVAIYRRAASSVKKATMSILGIVVASFVTYPLFHREMISLSDGDMDKTTTVHTVCCKSGSLMFLVANIASNFIYWFVFHLFDQDTALMSIPVVSILAGTVDVAITTPLWVIILRHIDSGLPVHDIMYAIIEIDGIRGFWRGARFNMLLLTFPMIRETVFFNLVALIGVSGESSDLQSRLVLAFLIGGIASAVATLITYPVQIVRARAQLGRPWIPTRTAQRSCQGLSLKLQSTALATGHLEIFLAVLSVLATLTYAEKIEHGHRLLRSPGWTQESHVISGEAVGDQFRAIMVADTVVDDNRR